MAPRMGERRRQQTEQQMQQQMQDAPSLMQRRVPMYESHVSQRKQASVSLLWRGECNPLEVLRLHLLVMMGATWKRNEG